MRTNLLLLFMSLSLFLAAQSASTFINEISYTASNPVQRGFELAGQAGSNLDGWQMISYNLSGLQQFSMDLSGKIIPNQQNGYGTIWYDMDQGGNGGGLALVDASGTVQEFVAYGAVALTGALDGAASGLQPNYLGDALPGASLQLIGSGTTSPTFQWAAHQTPSAGGVNAGQLFLTYLAVSSSSNNSPLSSATLSQHHDNYGTPAISYNAFPNPVRSQLQVVVPASLPDDQRFLLLYNQNGQQVLRQAIGNDQLQESLELQTLNAGAYYLVVQGKNSNWQETIIVK